MTPVRIIDGPAIPFARANIDTDLIIPARHLKTISREGLGQFAFEALRGQGSPFDDPMLVAAPILLAGENFGCGSSREHAVWALLDRGIRAIVAPSFSDIFASNAFKNGLVAATLPGAEVARLLDHAPAAMRIDLEAMIITVADVRVTFELDPFRRHCLLEGLDEIGLTLRSGPEIDAYESAASLAFLREVSQSLDDRIDHLG